MKFGIFVFGDNHPGLGRSNQKYYEEVLTIADWAEELGFDSFWPGEHHFYWYGTLPSPPMLIAALGQRTKKLRLGPAISRSFPSPAERLSEPSPPSMVSSPSSPDNVSAPEAPIR